MTLPPPSACRRIRKLFALLGSPNPNEAANAKERLLKLLAKHGLTWNDLAAVFTSGHGRVGGLRRFIGGSPWKFSTFATLAVAAIGVMPLPLMHRSIVINMQRSSVRLEQLDELDPTFPAVREELRKWAATCS